MATLAEIRAKLKEQESRNSGDAKPQDKMLYPFWNLKEGDSALLRFLPDGNQDNTFFWVEKSMIRLPFAGVKGGDRKPVTLNVPCMEMYNETCPILSEVRGWFKDPTMEEMGRKYWKKRTYIFQGFVVEDGLKESEKPELPIRRFVISPQIFQLVKASLMDPELDDMPTDFVNGIDFKVIKSTKGGYADYSTSKWSRRSRSLNEDELTAINEHGLFDLSSFLPKKPTEIELKVIMEMFEASVDGQAFDLDRWGQYYKPYGTSSSASHDNDDDVSSTPVKSVKPVSTVSTSQEVDGGDIDDDDDPPFTPSPKPKEETGKNGRAEEILQMIRSRQKQ